jgi:hypothetical protein
MNKFPPNVHHVRRLRYSGDISQALEKPSRNFTQVGEAPTWKILSHQVKFFTMYTPSLKGKSFILRLKLNLIIHFSSHFHSLLLPSQTTHQCSSTSAYGLGQAYPIHLDGSQLYAFFMYWGCRLKISSALNPQKKRPNYEY